MKRQHPSALSAFNHMINVAKGKQIVVFLDYDGTLSPIVSDPECAFMSDQVLITIGARRGKMDGLGSRSKL